MKITKHEHATLEITKAGGHLLLDPGVFLSLADFAGVTTVVITHSHADHWTPENLQRIVGAVGAVPILAPADIAAAAPEGVEITVVHPGDAVEAGGFSLRFFGGVHNVIHASVPVPENVGVLVDDEFYYPGDSYTVPEGVEVGTLAAPLGGPWLKIGEAIDFVLAVAPRRAIYAHDMTLSAAGKGMHVERLTWATAQGGGTFTPLEVGESLEV